MSGQLSELRRQVQAAGAEAAATRAAVEDRRPTGPTMAATTAAPAPPEPPARAQGASTSAAQAFDRLTLERGTIDLLGLDLARERVPAARPPAAARTASPTPIRPAAARREPAPAVTPRSARRPEIVAPTRRTEIESLAAELRRLYARLDGYRKEPTISRARERQRERDLGDYDTSLIHVCSALDVPTGLRAGETMTIERRAALTKTLARLGLDVRADPTGTAHRA
jgi:hypothetical protein